jgi:DNA polymerase III subunit delta
MSKSVHALVGSDLFLQLEALRGIIHTAPAGVQRFDFDGASAELAEVLDELRSFAMFSAAKVVVVREADEFLTRYRPSLEQYVSKPAPGSILVLRLGSLPKTQKIHKLIAASGQIHDCNPPKAVRGWIVQRAKTAHGLNLGGEVAGLLEELVGNDLGRLDNELAKLSLQCEGKAVEGGMVRVSVAFQREQEMWDMTNEVAAGNTTAALRRWRQLVQLDSSAEYRAVTWLTIWLEKVRRGLALKRQGWREAEIARELKIWPADSVTRFFRTAEAIGMSGAGRLIDELAELDRRSKSGLGDMAGNVERFLLMAARGR